MKTMKELHPTYYSQVVIHVRDGQNLLEAMSEEIKLINKG